MMLGLQPSPILIHCVLNSSWPKTKYINIIIEATLENHPTTINTCCDVYAAVWLAIIKCADRISSMSQESIFSPASQSSNEALNVTTTIDIKQPILSVVSFRFTNHSLRLIKTDDQYCAILFLVSAENNNTATKPIFGCVISARNEDHTSAMRLKMLSGILRENLVSISHYAVGKKFDALANEEGDTFEGPNREKH